MNEEARERVVAKFNENGVTHQVMRTMDNKLKCNCARGEQEGECEHIQKTKEMGLVETWDK